MEAMCGKVGGVRSRKERGVVTEYILQESRTKVVVLGCDRKSFYLSILYAGWRSVSCVLCASQCCRASG